MGYYKDGEYIKSERFDGKVAFDRAKTRQAVADCLLAVQDGSMTAQQALRFLLPEFPLLRQEKRRGQKIQQLMPFIPYYVAEMFGKPKPEPKRKVVYSAPVEALIEPTIDEPSAEK